jgi:O-antigen ligase
MGPAAPQEKLRFGLGLFGLAFYLWVIHSYKLNAGDLAILVLGVGTLTRGGKVRFPGFLAAFGIFILWSALSLAVSADVATSSVALTDLVKLWIISFLVVNVIRTPAELRFIFIAWLGLFALYPIRGALFNQFICQCTESGRVAWNFIFSNPNDLAALSLFPMGAAAGVASVERNKIFRLAGIVGIFVLALVILLTQSRGAMIALGAAVIMLPLTSRRRARDVVVLTVLVGIAALVAPKEVWQRLSGLSKVSVNEGMAGVDTEGSAASRWTIWGIAATQVRDHPLTGIGVGMMPEKNRLAALQQGLQWEVRGQRDTHSTYLRIAAETGYPGLLLYLLMWGLAIVKIKRAKAAIKHVRPREFQFLTFIELSVFAFLAASVFGTYGTLSFTYLSLAYVWLAADIFTRHSWYVPVDSRDVAAAPGLATSPRSQRRRTV